MRAAGLVRTASVTEERLRTGPQLGGVGRDSTVSVHRLRHHLEDSDGLLSNIYKASMGMILVK